MTGKSNVSPIPANLNEDQFCCRGLLGAVKTCRCGDLQNFLCEVLMIKQVREHKNICVSFKP